MKIIIKDMEVICTYEDHIYAINIFADCLGIENFRIVDVYGELYHSIKVDNCISEKKELDMKLYLPDALGRLSYFENTVYQDENFKEHDYYKDRYIIEYQIINKLENYYEVKTEYGNVFIERSPETDEIYRTNSKKGTHYFAVIEIGEVSIPIGR